MVSETRSARKSKNESDGHSSKRKVNTRKKSSACSPGNAGKISTPKQMTSSPQSTRKSKRLDKEMQPVSPPVNRISERLGRYNTPSPLRRSVRGKKELSSCSSTSKQSSKEPGPLESKRKKEKPLIKVTKESKKTEPEQEGVGMKRKKMASRRYRALFKIQHIQENVQDGDEELDSIGSERMGVVGELRDESVDRASNGALQELIYSARSRDVGSDSSESSVHHEVADTVTSPHSKCENCNLIGTCVQCSKNRRVGYNSSEQELCSCSHMDRGGPGAALSSDSQVDVHQNVCALCNKDGELLHCMGKGCKRCYHICCLDPSLADVPPGVWHCPKCVKKKLLFGVHSVSEGVESIWDVREVEVSNVKGVKQKQYLVKYHGLAHIHNHWVSEKNLMPENPHIVSRFAENYQTVRWSTEWMVPHRLLRKRPIQDKIFIACSAVISACEYEWLVKWRGLDYDHATWELDNSSFLSSSLGQNLMKDYEVRRLKAKKDYNNKLCMESIVKLPVLPASRSHVNVNSMLKNMNKLRECLLKCLNAVVFDDQEQMMTIIIFIQLMSEICRPFLIVTTSGSLSQWEAEFAQLLPSLDVVVYSGSTDTRKGIRASEFYDEEGCMMVQVLLSSIEAVSEDLEILRCIKWKAIVIDEYQNSGISNSLEQIKMLSTDTRILLVTGQIKDTTSEYVKLLSLIEPHSDFDKLKGLKLETNDSLCKLKERLSRFIAYGRASQVSKFIEYWIPIHISNYQLEHYCATLLCNSTTLCSYSRSDRVGALRDILLTVRKCCNHPYLLDSSVQECLVAKQCPAAELLDIGIKASGKLQLLDVMLTEIKTRGLQALILFQLIMGSGGASTGDIMDDFLHQRFGPNTYERIDASLSHSKKQAAVNRFNEKETGQFVLLLENRACSCSSVIKLSSVDIVIIYDSDWNPANDMRALQKITIGSKVEQIKVFRLYSTLTIEERALVLSKQSLNLDNNLQNSSRATSDTLLLWGAKYLFSRLDEYHADIKSNSEFDFSSDQLLLDEVAKEFHGILSENRENTDSGSVISEVKLGVGSYYTNTPVLGEAKVQLKDGEEPHVFWKNLFEGKNPKWKHLKTPSPRNRKRVHYLEGSHKSEIGKDDTVKKHKKMVNENMNPASVQVESSTHQVTPDDVSRGGISQNTLASLPRSSSIKACIQSENFQRENQSSVGAEVSVGAASDERIVSSEKQKSLHSVLQGEMIRLCRTLKLSEDVTHVVRKFLEYVIKNHHVNSDSPSIVQAFQISLCWVAASISKQKVDKKETFMLAKQQLNYQCTEEQAHSVYSKMRSLKRIYLQSTDSFTDSDRDCLLNEEGINKEPSNVDGGGSHFSSSKQKNVKLATVEKSYEEHVEGHILVQKNSALKDKTAASEIDDKIKKIQRKSDKRIKKLVLKQQQEIQEFQQIWEKKRQDLEDDHKLEVAFLRSMQYQDSVGLNKLKLLEDKFATKIEEHILLKDVQLKQLEAKQLASINEEKLKAIDWLFKAKTCWGINGQQLVNFQSDDDAEHPQPCKPINSIANEDVLPMSEQHVEPENMNKSSQGNDIAPSEDLPVPNEALGHVHPGELDNASNEESNKAGKIASSDDFVCQRDGTEEAASGGLNSTEQSSLPSEKTKALPDYPQNVQQDETARILGSAQLQDSNASAVQNQTSSLVEVEILEPVDSVAPVPSDHEILVTDEIVTPIASSHEETANDRSQQQPSSSVGASLNCNQAPATENQNQERSSSQVADPGAVEMHFHESISLSEENLAIHPDQLEQSYQAVPPLEINLPQPINNARATHQPTYLNLPPTLLEDPLQKELERIRKETEQWEKTLEDTMSQLKADCEKEIKEFISQIRNKYSIRLKETEAEFRSKRNELDKNQKKVLLNKILADAVRSKCSELKPSAVRGAQQGGPSNSVQQLHQTPWISRSPGFSGSHPTRTQPIPTSPAMQNPQQLLRSHLLRSTTPVAIQTVAPLTITARPVQEAAPQVLGPPSRPPIISVISPAGNLRTPGNESRSIAPHLQPSRPIVAPSTPATIPQLTPQLQPVQMRPPLPGPLPRAPQQPLSNLVPPTNSQSAPQLQPVQMRPPQQPSPSLVTQERTGLQGGVPLAPPNPSLITEGVCVPERRIPSLPDISTTFTALEQSDLEMLGSSVKGNQTSDVVCLSDD